MNYKLKALSNGLRVLIVPMPSLPSMTVSVWVKTGSRNEEKRIGGISHFLEHMVFKGSKNRPTTKEIAEAVDAIGGEFNAGTSKDWTNFYIKARSEHLDLAMDILSDMVLRPLLESEEIEREKGTIIQEINMYEDTPMIKVGDVFEEAMFEGNPLGWDVAGNAKSVTAIKREDFVGYRNRHYYAKNMLLTVAGGVNEEQVLKLANKYFQDLKPSNSPFKGFSFKGVQKEPRLKIKDKKSEQAHFILGFPAEGRGYKGRFAQNLLTVILGGGMSSRLFIEVRERRGLAYSVRTSMERYQEVGYMGTYVGTDPKKVDESIKIVLEEHKKIANGEKPVTAAELNKTKEFVKGHLALGLEDTHAAGEYFGMQGLFLGKIMTPEEVYKEFDKVSLKDIQKEAKKIINFKKINLAIIGPYSDESKFRKLLK